MEAVAAPAVIAEVVPITPVVAASPAAHVEPVVISAGKISKKEYIIAGLIIVTIIGVAIYIASQNKPANPQRVRNPNIQ